MVWQKKEPEKPEDKIIPHSEPRIVENWYMFNDSGVTPVAPEGLSSKFGGSAGNAYMLVYRQRKVNPVDP